MSRRAILVLLLPILSGAALGRDVAGADTPGSAIAPPRVLLIGIDGADLRIIDRLIAAGKLPTFARLEREGAAGPLRSQEPLISPIVWTTIATGRPPQDHGILDFIEVDARGVPSPIASLRRKVPALWNIAGEFGKTSGFVGWYASYPAERVAGFEVSDRLGFHQVSSARAVAGATFPEEVGRLLKARFGEPAPDVAATRRRFVSGAVVPAGDAADRLEELARIHATSEFYRKAVFYLQGRYRTDLLAVYFEGIDACGHLFMEDAPPRRPGVSPEEFRAFSETVDRYYEYQDEVLGDLLRLEGPRTVTVVLSDHGFKTGDLRPQTSGRAATGIAPLWHRLDGVLFLHGSGVRAAGRIERAGILDVAPTVLAILGIPLSRELPGRVLSGAFRPGDLGALPRVARYRAPPPRPKPDAPPDPEAVRKLMALGYLSGAEGAKAHDAEGRMASSYVNEGQVLARAGDWRGALRAYGEAAALDPRAVGALAPAAALYLQHGEWSRAEELLRRASKIEPGNLWVLVQKASLNLQRSRLEEAARDLSAAERLDERLPGIHLLGARIEKARGNATRALAELDRAESLIDSDEMRAEALLLRAQIQTSLGRYADAERSLDHAASRGELAFSRRDAAGAVRWFRAAAAANPGSSPLERQLGEALGASGKSGEAEAAFKRAILKAKTREERESAWGDLSLLYQKTGRESQALACFRDAVAAVPDSNILWSMLGAAFGRSGNLESSIGAYEKSIALKPTALACKTLAALYFEVRKDSKRATALWKQSLELEPNQPEVREFLRRYGRTGPSRGLS